MKRLLLLALITLVLVFFLTACFFPYLPVTKKDLGNDKQSNIKTTSPTKTQPTERQKTIATTTKPDDNGAVIKGNSILLDRDGLVIVAKELKKGDLFGGIDLKLLFENNTEKNLVITFKELTVNNFMLDQTYFRSTITPGNKANETINISSSFLEDAGINEIEYFFMIFGVFENDLRTHLYDSEEVELKTSLYGTAKSNTAPAGIELLNERGIRIVATYVEEGSPGFAKVATYIENNCGSDIEVSIKSISVNGYMVDGFMFCEVNDGREAVDTINILQSDLKDNDIEKFVDIELSFEISEKDTWRTIFKTDPISFTVP
jgi:hypothetical protein